MRWGGLYDHGSTRRGASNQRRSFGVMHTPEAVDGHTTTLYAPPPQTSWVVGVGGNTTSRSVCLGLQNTHTTGSTTPVNTYSELYTCPLLHPLPRAHGLNRSNFSASVSSADVYRAPLAQCTS